jgi:hypothetical protein
MPPTLAAYVPFLTPLPVWDYWYLLLVPLCAGVAVVYKAIKAHEVRRIPWEATVITLWILFGMIGAAAALAVVVQWLA